MCSNETLNDHPATRNKPDTGVQTYTAPAGNRQCMHVCV